MDGTGRTINRIFLNEHGCGFVASLRGSQSIALSGGAIRELNGLRAGSLENLGASCNGEIAMNLTQVIR